MNRNHPNLLEWLKHRLTEADVPPIAGQPDQGGFGPPMTGAGNPNDPMGDGTEQPAPPQGSPSPSQGQDVSNDPQFPEMPDQDDSASEDFEIWREKYINESVKGDPNKLNTMCLTIRDRELDTNPRKFVEDNIQINLFRQDANIFEASQKLRKLLKQDIDRNLPSTTLIKHMSAVLEEHPLINDIFIKLTGTMGGKQDYHRKFISALLGAVQVGSGSNNEDLIFQETQFSIPISTRFNSKWGDVVLGPWDLTEDDPKRFLKEPEMDRLQGGSPEERDVLRRRVVIESIADQFKQRSFVITTVGTDGAIHHVGLDIGNALMAGYIDGRLIVRSENSDNRRSFISDEGDIVNIPELTIYYVREVEGGFEPQTEEIEFIRHRDGQLFLSAQADLLVEASSTLQGVLFKEIPWRGNPTDFLNISRNTPSLVEILLRRVPS